MTETRYNFSNLGGGSAGSATVGYTLINFDSTFSTHTARSTTVTEIGTSTGVWGATFDVEAGANLLVLWDTGGASPLYAWNESLSSAGTIAKTNDDVRIIKNTIRNTSDHTAEMMTRIAGFSDRLADNTGQAQTFETTLKEGLVGIPGINEKLSQMEVQLAMATKQVTPTVDMPTAFQQISKQFNDVKSSLGTITRLGSESKRIKNVESHLTAMEQQINGAMERLATFMGQGFQNLASKHNISEEMIGGVTSKLNEASGENFSSMLAQLAKELAQFKQTSKHLNELYSRIFTTNEEMKMVMTETKRNNIRQMAPYLMKVRRKK